MRPIGRTIRGEPVVLLSDVRRLLAEHALALRMVAAQRLSEGAEAWCGCGACGDCCLAAKAEGHAEMADALATSLEPFVIPVH